MTKKVFFSLSVFILLISIPTFSQVVTSQAMPQQTTMQQMRVGYVNTTKLLEALPEREAATQQLITLSENYKKELQIMQNEYNKKYSDYITYQSSLAENIKLRRMQELTELEKKMQQFMELAQQDIKYQEQGLLKPLKERINEAIKAVGIEQGYTVIYDIADPSIVFVTQKAVDANPLVLQKIGIQQN